MSKPTFRFSMTASEDSPNSNSNGLRRSPLAELVSERLKAKGLRQIDFCRQTGFDQGLLSKILSSVVSTLNVETALKLAEGLNVAPSVVFEAIGKRDVDEMLRRFYSNAAPINQAV
ncbi:MAG TPA: helix-turn-helix transcriptional regulator [Blastocatellia bacterium]|nr:helix-turn-helix transcriptional regulator [Blastocatellia bacterium]